MRGGFMYVRCGTAFLRPSLRNNIDNNESRDLTYKTIVVKSASKPYTLRRNKFSVYYLLSYDISILYWTGNYDMQKHFVTSVYSPKQHWPQWKAIFASKSRNILRAMKWHRKLTQYAIRLTGIGEFHLFCAACGLNSRQMKIDLWDLADG